MPNKSLISAELPPLPGYVCTPKRIKRSAQHILVLVESGGLEALPDSRPHCKRSYMPAAMRCVGVEAFIKNNNQNAILLEPRIIEQWRNIIFEPCVGRR